MEKKTFLCLNQSPDEEKLAASDFLASASICMTGTGSHCVRQTRFFVRPHLPPAYSMKASHFQPADKGCSYLLLEPDVKLTAG